MKLDYKKELQSIIYDESAVKVLRPLRYDADTVCFTEHWHERIELLLLEEGSMYLTVEGKTWQAKAGDVALIPPGAVHTARTDNEPVFYHVVIFDVNTFLTDVRGNRRLIQPIISGKAIFPNVIHEPQAVHAIRSLVDMYRAGENYSSLFLTSYIYLFFGLLYQNLAPETAAPPVSDNNFLEVLNYIDAHFTEPLSVAEISERFGYAESHFCRRFKATLGLTPTHYIRTLRMEEAKRLLEEGKRSISEVAAACGFPDSGYFTRCFKKVYGYAPSRYVARCQEDGQVGYYVRRLRDGVSPPKTKA